MTISSELFLIQDMLSVVEVNYEDFNEAFFTLLFQKVELCSFLQFCTF